MCGSVCRAAPRRNDEHESRADPIARNQNEMNTITPIPVFRESISTSCTLVA